MKKWIRERKLPTPIDLIFWSIIIISAGAGILVAIYIVNL